MDGYVNVTNEWSFLPETETIFGSKMQEQKDVPYAGYAEKHRIHETKSFKNSFVGNRFVWNVSSRNYSPEFLEIYLKDKKL